MYHDTLIQTLSLKYAKLLIRSEDVGYLRNKLICLSTLITKCENYELSLFVFIASGNDKNDWLSF